MSVTVTSTPFKLGWARNRNSYKMSCNTLVSNGSNGTFYCTRVAAIPAAGNHVVVNIDGVEYIFTIVASNPGAYEMASNDDLFNKIRSCWYVRQVFGIPLQNNDTTHLVLVTQSTRRYFDIYCTDAYGNRTGYESTMLSWLTSAGFGPGYQGTDPVYLKNYAVAAKVEVVVNNNNNLTTHNVDGLVFQPDNNGNIEVPMDLLGELIPQPDIPATNESSWAVTTNALMKYRLHYGEMWGDDTPLIQNWQQNPAGNTAWNYVLCGSEADRFSRLNLSDWDNTNVLFSETNSLFRILGEKSGLNVRVCKSQLMFLYGMWFDTTQALTATTTLTIQVQVGGGSATTTTRKVRNGEIYRIPVHPSVFSAASSLFYSVTFSMGGVSWTRTFYVMPDYYQPTTFLIQNKYGLLNVLVAPQVRREMTTEADVLQVDRRRYLDITEDSETYTATTALMTREEARQLAMCLGQKFHYVMSGTNWLRISIEAGSFTVLDEAEEMVRVEFNYRFTDNQEENIVSGSMARSTGATLSDFNDQVVCFSDRTPATHNSLL